MGRLARTTVGAIAALALGGAGAACAGAADLAERMEVVRQESKLPALGGLLLQDGNVKALLTTGVRKQGDATPATANDQWHLGSCTKAMTATVVATFVEAKALRWDATLGELLADWPALHPAYRNVTIEMLLAHRGGVVGDLTKFDGGRLWASLWDPSLDPVVGRRRVREAVLAAPPATTPGSTFAYANAGYMIVGSLLEKISGRSWEALVNERLFTPLAMTSCGFGAAGRATAARPDQPWGHAWTGAALEPVAPGPRADNPPSVGPAGTVHCSLLDWGKFAALHLDGDAGRPTPILHAASFAKLHAAYPGQTYTYGGWERLERDWAHGPALAHVGSNTLNVADLWLAPGRRLGLLATSNASDAVAVRPVDRVIGLLLDAAEGR
jgi:CubicO group peptidase (beta-lactamase class C family)